MKVTVNDDRCRGHGMCLTICPEVFTITDDGYSEAQSGDVPVEFEQVVREAVTACPEQAITAQ